MASFEMKLRPWIVPNFATLEMPVGRREDGPRELPTIAVADLSEEALTELAQQWLDELYKKAGKARNYSFVSGRKSP